MRAATPEELELARRAGALADARADGETHSVAAIARAGDGSEAVGMNVFHFTGGPCAELVALGALAAVTDSPLARIVAAGDRGRGVLAPCGRCRQVLLDLHPDAEVIVPGADGVAEIVGVPELLPGAYGWAREE
jgi:cytidine deaminase